MTLRGPMSQPYQALVMLVLTVIWGRAAVEVLGYVLVSPGMKGALFAVAAVFAALAFQGWLPVTTRVLCDRLVYQTMGTRHRDIPFHEVESVEADGAMVWLVLVSGERLPVTIARDAGVVAEKLRQAIGI
ncbi:MAG: hypothetical protein AB1758_15970 [Candidatus Eremiobacterota bacterium]